MYNFIDVNEASESVVLPSEALKINGEYIENQIRGYKTLNVSGREALSPLVETYTTGVRDGSRLKGRRYPERYITVTYQIIADSNEEFREAYNQLGKILNVEDAELIFNDEQDKFFIGTPCSIDAVEPGRNAVVGSFEIVCTDPFKYSVMEYEAETDLIDNGFLIDYKGTYKAYPTLEAEFYQENESDGKLTGDGDCGYVAFFTEDKKIIQLGDPGEANTEDYAKSQTLVSQKFITETAWGTIAQTNWPTNTGMLLKSNLQQSGSVNVAVSAYLKTNAPSTSGTLLSKRSSSAKPYIDYKVVAETSGRQADRIDVKVTVTATVAGSSSSTSITAGAKVTLDKTKIYTSATSSSSAGTKTGTYYLWDDSVKSGRIRITNSSSNVGVSGQVTGWVNVSDIGATATSTIGSGYGLKASVDLGSTGWKAFTLKKESASWKGGNSYKATLNVTVKDITADTSVIEDIKFKVERTDSKNDKIGILNETDCADLEISTYTAPVANGWYLTPSTYGTSSEWHGPSITRTIPADAAGDDGAKNFTFSYRQKMAIGSSSSATQEMGALSVLLVTGTGSSRKVVAGVDIYKDKSGANGKVDYYVNGKKKKTTSIDLSYNNPYFGHDSNGNKAVKTSTITKQGATVNFDIGGIKVAFNDPNVKNVAVTEITLHFAQYGTKPTLYYNGVYWVKFVKNNCDTWSDIPNKFSANDIVTADCKNGDIYLNGTPTPALGALGNDWEEFFLSPGFNQIGCSYSDWVKSAYAPTFRLRYREVFL